MTSHAAPPDQVRIVRASERIAPATQTSGMTREQAFELPGAWVGTVRTKGGMASGWHHHDGHDSFIFVLKGRFELEFGPGGKQRVVAGPGDFLHVPRHAVHRERNPDPTDGEAVVVRVGSGEVAVNVEGPEPG